MRGDRAELGEERSWGRQGAGWPTQPGSPVASLLTLLCRIQKSMLLDLNKEIMNELGVTVVGDIIAILKHAKVVHRQVSALRHPSVPGFRVGERDSGRAQGGLEANMNSKAVSTICCVTLGTLPNLSGPFSICRMHIDNPIL